MYKTLKEIGAELRKIKRRMRFQQSITKENESNEVLNKLAVSLAMIVSAVKEKCDPKNVARCSLSKKKQRRLGLLPPVAAKN